MIAAKVASSGVIERISQEWRLPMELAIDLVRWSDLVGVFHRPETDHRLKCLFSTLSSSWMILDLWLSVSLRTLT